MVGGMFMFVQQCFWRSPSKLGAAGRGNVEKCSKWMFELREGYSSCTAYLALFFVRISTCSWKSVIISLCFFFKSVAVSSDSRWTSSSSLRSFSSSASRLRLASNCQRELLQSLWYIVVYILGMHSLDVQHHPRPPRGARTSVWPERWGRLSRARSGEKEK